MIGPRRFFPSTSSLLALEAVDRLGSASAAAEELSMTHSAVSRQLKVLEGQLEVSLFLRGQRRIGLTEAGKAYARTIRTSLKEIAQASLTLRAGGSKKSINLAVLPSFANHCLMPLVVGFTRAHEGVLINQSARPAPFSFEQERFDAAIHFGDQDWPNVEYLPIRDEKIIPCGTPDMVRAIGGKVENFLNLPMLHLETRPGAWEAWLAQQGCEAERLRGMLFDSFAGLAEAAACGAGLALLPDYLAEKYFAEGRLVPAWKEFTPSKQKYYLVWPSNVPPSGTLGRFIDWMRNAMS